MKHLDGIDVTDDIDHVGYKNPYRYRGYRGCSWRINRIGCIISWKYDVEV